MKKDPRTEVVSDRGQETMPLSNDATNALIAVREGWEQSYGKRDAHATFAISDIKMLVDGIEDFGGSLSEREMKEALDELVDKGLCDRCGAGCYVLTAKGAAADV